MHSAHGRGLVVDPCSVGYSSPVREDMTLSKPKKCVSENVFNAEKSGLGAGDCKWSKSLASAGTV
jgi:hypothetical protein